MVGHTCICYVRVRVRVPACPISIYHLAAPMHHSANPRQHHRGLLLCRMATFIWCRVSGSALSYGRVCTELLSFGRSFRVTRKHRARPVIYRAGRWFACRALSPSSITLLDALLIFSTPLCYCHPDRSLSEDTKPTFLSSIFQFVIFV